MKKSILALALTVTACGAFAADAPAEEDINYGDPTAVFTSAGISKSNERTQLNGIVGWGEGNMVFADFGVEDKDTSNFDYRLRYFKVSDGFGTSVDVMGGADSTTALAGGIYKFQINDNISLFPMLYAGYMTTDYQTEHTHKQYDPKTDGLIDAKYLRNENFSSGLIQAGLYGMYGWDEGHWLYANPKATYIHNANGVVPQIEVGGGYMVTPEVSVGFKVEHTADHKLKINGRNIQRDADTVGWLQASYYF